MRRTYAWLAFIATLLLLLILTGFLSIWVSFGSPANIMNQVNLQRVRSELLVKDVLILNDPPSSSQQAQALSELQDVLPRWEQAQQALQTGDASLGLPARPPADVQLALVQAQSDYVAMQVALRTILAHPHPIDNVQMQIVLAHEHNYVLTMNQVIAVWQQHIDGAFIELFDIEAILVSLIAIVVIVNFVFSMRALHTPRHNANLSVQGEDKINTEGDGE